MTTILRVFIKPAGQVHVDIPLSEGQNIGAVMYSWKCEGALYNANSMVPYDSCLYAMTYELPAGAKLTVVPGPWKPETPA